MPSKDPEARRAYMKAYHEKNRERARENQRRYQENNQEKVKEYQRQYYLKNKEKVRARQKAQEAEDPEAYRRRKAEAARRWAEANPDRVRENARRRWAKTKYGLTLEEVDAILARGCAICGTHKGRVVGKRGRIGTPEQRLCLDHDHKNGKVRDALCHSCNTGLGSFKDDPARLRAAADYLDSHRT
jgi:Recombination endonuclease VII